MQYQIVSESAKRVIKAADTREGSPSRYIWADAGTSLAYPFNYNAARNLVRSMLKYAEHYNLPETAPEWNTCVMLYEEVATNGERQNSSNVIDVSAYRDNRG